MVDRYPLRDKQVSRSRIGMAALALAFALSLTACEVVAGDDDPLRPPPEAHGIIVPSVEVSQVFTDGSQVFVVQGEDPVRISSVEFIGADPQLEVVDVRIADENRLTTWTAVAEPLPLDYTPDVLHPLEEAVLLPQSQQTPGAAGHRGYQLLLSIRLTEPGIWHRDGIRLRYTADGQSYVWESFGNLVACTAEFADEEGSCNAMPTP